VSVLVRDADTKKPIAAQVQVSYPLSHSPLAPGSSSQTTGKDGVAHLHVTPSGDAGIVVGASANAYLAEEKVVPLADVKAIQPAGLFEAVEQRPVTYVLELYAEEPRLNVELIVPTGYCGEVRVEVQVQEEAPAAPGQRLFRYEVPASGNVLVSGPALFRHLSSPDFTARYADGPVLNREPSDGGIGLWCLKDEGRFYTLLVGTRAMYEQRRPTPNSQQGAPSSGSRGGRGRGGRGGRRGGNQPPADPGQS
jgi:hypothetical protein